MSDKRQDERVSSQVIKAQPAPTSTAHTPSLYARPSLSEIPSLLARHPASDHHCHRAAPSLIFTAFPVHPLTSISPYLLSAA
jgi:hypothetical protein